MKEEDLSQDVMKILDQAPGARKALRENYDNLLNVADYCYDNYIQAGDSSSKALEETRKLASQALASVAYQISTLASSVLSLLDAQTNQLLRLESSITLIGQTVEMHKEKVSRREIGTFTAVKRVPRCHKILPPTETQPRPPYSRRPINYQQLDGIGHGVKVSGKQAEKTGTIRKPSVRSNKALEPVRCPVAPPAGSSSFGKPVAPPSVPPTSDIITTLLEEAPPPPPPSANETQSDMADSLAPPPPPPPPPEAPAENSVAPPPPPPPPPPTPSEAPSKYSTPPLAPPIAPPLTLETVEEENSLPSPSPPPPPPPPPEDEDAFPPLPSDSSGLLAPPPPPALSQEEEEALLSRSRRRRRSPPASRSLSLRVRSGPASRCRYARSLFLPAVQSLMIPPPPPYPPPHAPAPPSSPFSLLPPPSSCSASPRRCLPARLQHLDLEIPAPPPPLLLDERIEFDDIIPPLPPPVDYDVDAPQQYLEKAVALYPYDASSPDQLSLAHGDVVYLTRRLDDGWCEGVVNGNRGLLPENYVQSSG